MSMVSNIPSDAKASLRLFLRALKRRGFPIMYFMNIKSFTSLTVSAICLSLISVPILSHSSNAQIQVEENNLELPEDRVTFYCGEITGKETGEVTPTTLAYVPQRKAHIPIVAWKSNHLAAWNPERRCQAVSANFQTFNEDGRLNYLSNGESAGYPIICALLDKQEKCSGENQLFQLRAGSNPEDVIVGLKDILGGKTTGTDIIEQRSGQKTYISVSGLLENAPAIEDESLISR